MLPSIDENSSFSCIIVIFLNKILLEIKVFSSLFRFFNSTVIESKVILLRTAWHKTSSNGFTGCYNSAERMQYFSYLNNLTLRETQALMSYSAYIMINLFYLLEKSLVPFFFCSWYLFFDIQFVFKNFFGISFHYILTSIQGFLRTFFFFLFANLLVFLCFVGTLLSNASFYFWGFCGTLLFDILFYSLHFHGIFIFYISSTSGFS